MTRSIRLALVAVVAATVLSGCLTVHPPEAARTVVPAFRPEVFFDGQTWGEGTLKIRGRAAQTVHVESRGQAEPGGFRLDQTIRIGDEPPRERTWHMRPAGPGRYTSELTDADGEVTAVVEGNRLTIRYPMRRHIVTMEQRLTLAPGGQSAQNLATVRMLGVPWARLVETITRGEPPQTEPTRTP